MQIATGIASPLKAELGLNVSETFICWTTQNGYPEQRVRWGIGRRVRVVQDEASAAGKLRPAAAGGPGEAAGLDCKSLLRDTLGLAEA